MSVNGKNGVNGKKGMNEKTGTLGTIEMGVTVCFYISGCYRKYCNELTSLLGTN